MADYFVDYSATNDGDGSAYSQAASAGGVGAYNTVHNKVFSSGDKVWIRRVEKLTHTTQIIFHASNDNILFIGWPKSTDEHYSTRPSAAQATWDADSADYPVVNNTGYSAGASPWAACSNCKFYRLEYRSTQNFYFYITGDNNKFYNCRSINNRTTDTGKGWYIQSGADRNEFYDCYADGRAGIAGDYGGVYHNLGSFTKFVRCTAVVENSEIESCAYYTTGDFPLFIDCQVTSSNFWGTGVYSNSRGLKWFGGYIKAENGLHLFRGTGVSTTADHIQGVELACRKIYSTSAQVAHIYIKKWVQSSGTAHAVEWYSATTLGGGTLYLNDTTFATNSINDLKVNSSVNILCKNVNFSTNPINYNTGDITKLYQGLRSLDHENVKDSYQIIHNAATITKTTSVYKSGGTYSLKYEPTGTDGLPILIGINGYETIWVPVIAGSCTINIYGAYKTFTGLKKDDIWIEGDYLDQASGATRATATSRGTSYQDTVATDTSTWTGDTVTQFKLSLTFTVGQDCIVPIRIGFNAYVASGIIYLDPMPEVIQ